MIHPLDHILQRLEFIQTVLESPYSAEEGNILNQRMQDVSIYMAEAGKLKADAQFHYKQVLKSETIKAIKDLIPEWSSAKVQNAVIEGLAAHEFRIVTFAERVNASCTHQLDVMRSQLSYLKSLANFER